MPRARYNTLVIPYRWRDGHFEFAIFHCRGSRMCQFMAGGGEDDEEPWTAALRETREESGIQAERDDWMILDAVASIPRASFPGAPWPEDVYVIPERCFAVNARNAEIVLSHEHERFAWLPYDAAQDELTWDSNKVALFELNERLKRAGQQTHAADAHPRYST